MSNAVLRERALLGLGLGLAAMAGFVTFAAIPGFKDVFQSFGADLPLLTSLSLKFYPALLALPLIVLAVWLAWPRKEKRGLVALVAGGRNLLGSALVGGCRDVCAHPSPRVVAVPQAAR